MPTYLNGRRPRRITKIRVDEISEVDRPANGIPFCMYKRDDSTPAPVPAPAPVCSIPELAEFAPRRASVNKSATPSEYDSAAINSLLGGILKSRSMDAQGDGTLIEPDGLPSDLTPEDYARERDRIDASGVVAVNSPKFYPSYHVPSAVDVTDPVTV